MEELTCPMDVAVPTSHNEEPLLDSTISAAPSYSFHAASDIPRNINLFIKVRDADKEIHRIHNLL